MEKIDINAEWEMRIIGQPACEYIKAQVPGSVMSDLLRAGKMEDPYYRDNEDAALNLMRNDFEYRTVFDMGGGADDADEVLLRAEGLDTIASVTLNGVHLGDPDNMHRVWEYEVKKYLKEKDNELVIVFKSPVEYIAQQFEQDPGILGTGDAMRGFPKIRKAHYMFGWDWGPRLPDAGIWKELSFYKVKSARFNKVYIRQDFNDDMSEVKLGVNVSVSPAAPGKTQDTGESAAPAGTDKTACALSCPEGKDLQVVVTVMGPEYASGSQSEKKSEPCVVGRASVTIAKEALNSDTPACVLIDVKNPELWWPNGLGRQPLYRVVTELVADGVTVDTDEKRIGMRKMQVSTARDEYGSEFAHVVNGVKFFAMGADYIPEDNILPRMNGERTYKLLKDCIRANFNCIRVWGGGIYPSDEFYDACDELGLVVWQDFMFACANYRLTAAFEESVREEIVCQVRRLAHHASLGLWCGNNEMELFAGLGEWGADDAIRRDYLKMYEDIFPAVIKKEDPDRFYWPASPSCGGGFDDPNCPDRGDTHYWEVWHGNKPFTEYRKFYFRYLSEFGFQSFPSMKTIETFTLPGDRNVFSYIMEKHQRNASANGKIMNYMEQTFLYPSDFDTFVYASQLMQAEAIRYGVEHFRRNRGRCMGTVYWQLNDCWPVASWSSIDYYGRWKALHYYAKRFFAPVMISCEEEGLVGRSSNVNEEPFEVKKSIRLCVANESLRETSGIVCWELRHADGSCKEKGTQEITVSPLSSQWLTKVELPEASVYDNYVSYRYTENGQTVSEGTVLFCAPKHFRFIDPGLKVRVIGNEIEVSASAYAKGVEIGNENDDLILSDNFFDLNADTKRVSVIEGNPEGIKVRSVFDIR